MSFRPRVVQPRVRVILVLAQVSSIQVSSMKTRRFGSSLDWSFRHRAR